MKQLTLTSTSEMTGASPRPTRGRRTKYQISEQEIKQYFKYSQAQAATMLNISVSTLKRRFYQMGMGRRWPHNNQGSTLANKVSISQLINLRDVDAREFDSQTEAFLRVAFSQ